MWFASVGSILVLSLVGLLAVAALPLLRGRHRKAALQVLHMLVVVGPVVMMVLMMAKLVLEGVVVPNSCHPRFEGRLDFWCWRFAPG